MKSFVTLLCLIALLSVAFSQCDADATASIPDIRDDSGVVKVTVGPPKGATNAEKIGSVQVTLGNADAETASASYNSKTLQQPTVDANSIWLFLAKTGASRLGGLQFTLLALVALFSLVAQRGTSTATALFVAGCLIISIASAQSCGADQQIALELVVDSVETTEVKVIGPQLEGSDSESVLDIVIDTQTMTEEVECGLELQGVTYCTHTITIKTSGCSAECGSSAVNNDGASCVDGQCVYECQGSYEQCDAGDDEGCPFDTNNLVDKCGGCDTVCPAGDPNGGGAAFCQNGVCQAEACNPGYLTCDDAFPCAANASDKETCGGCGEANDCGALEGKLNVIDTVCTSGGCVVSQCEPFYADCNRVVVDGCEASLDQDSNCGACGVDCNPDSDKVLSGVCASTLTGSNYTCEYTCNTGSGYDNCNPDSEEPCSTDIFNDRSNCGSCGTDCLDGDNVVGANCNQGTCEISECVEGFASCSPEDQCLTNTQEDPENCGQCGFVCADEIPNAAATECQSGVCVALSCNTGFETCDEGVFPPCNTQVDLTSACGCDAVNCDNLIQNAAATCTVGVDKQGICAFDACNAGFSDCNSDTTLPTPDGCEVDDTADNTCGGCLRTDANPGVGNNCLAGPNAGNQNSGTCTDGACVFECVTGFQTCSTDTDDSQPDFGCDTNLSDLSSCGGCVSDPPGEENCEAFLSNTVNGGGVVQCAINPDLSEYACRAQTCPLGTRVCNGEFSDDCTTDITTDSSNCGACGNECSAAGGYDNADLGSCVPVDGDSDAGVCDFTPDGSCLDTHNDCDGIPDNGCERSAEFCRPPDGSNGGVGQCEFASVQNTLCSDLTNIQNGNVEDAFCIDSTFPRPQQIQDAPSDNVKAALELAQADPPSADVYGTCFIVCQSGFLDCDRDPENGCEVEIGGSSNALCQQSIGVGVCYVSTLYQQFDFDANGVKKGPQLPGDAEPENFDCLNLLGNSILWPEASSGVDVQAIEDNIASETAICSDGYCLYSCLDGFFDCDKYPHNGCESSSQEDPFGNSCGDPENCNFVATDRCGSGSCVDCQAREMGVIETTIDGAPNPDYPTSDPCQNFNFYDDEAVGPAGFADGYCELIPSDDPNSARFHCDSSLCIDANQDWRDGCETAVGYASDPAFNQPIACSVDPEYEGDPHLASQPFCNGYSSNYVSGGIVVVPGRCAYECEAGWQDCDKDPRNGCETPEDENAVCGDCEVFADIRCGTPSGNFVGCLDCTNLPGTLMSEYSDAVQDGSFDVNPSDLNDVRAQNCKNCAPTSAGTLRFTVAAASASTCKLNSNAVFACDLTRHFLNPSYDFPDSYNGACQTEFCNDSDGDLTNGCEAAQLYGKGPNYYFGDNNVRNIWNEAYVPNKFQNAAADYNLKFAGRLGHTGIPQAFSPVTTDENFNEREAYPYSDGPQPVEWQTLLLMVRNLFSEERNYNPNLVLDKQPIIPYGTPQDCVLGEWSAWGDCTYDDDCHAADYWFQTRIRTRRIITKATNGGSCYLPLVEDWYEFTSRDSRLGDGLDIETQISNRALGTAYGATTPLKYVSRNDLFYGDSVRVKTDDWASLDALVDSNTPVLESTNDSGLYVPGTEVFVISTDQKELLIQKAFDGPLETTDLPRAGGDAMGPVSGQNFQYTGPARTCGANVCLGTADGGQGPLGEDCVLSPWSEWSECTAECDGEWAGSVRIRTRQVNKGAFGLNGLCFVDDYTDSTGQPLSLRDIPVWAGKLYQEDWGCNHQSCSEFDCSALAKPDFTCQTPDGTPVDCNIDISLGAITPQCDGRDWPVQRDLTIYGANQDFEIKNYDTSTYLFDALQDSQYEFRWPGHCLYECKVGFLDCNGDPRDGCETEETKCLFDIINRGIASHTLNTVSAVGGVSGDNNSPFNHVYLKQSFYTTSDDSDCEDYVNRDPTAHPWGKCDVAASDDEPLKVGDQLVKCSSDLYDALTNTVEECDSQTGLCSRDCKQGYVRCPGTDECVEISDEKCGAACIDCNNYPGNSIECVTDVESNPTPADYYCQRDCVNGCYNFVPGKAPTSEAQFLDGDSHEWITSAKDANGCETAYYKNPYIFDNQEDSLDTKYSAWGVCTFATDDSCSEPSSGWGECTHSDTCGFAAIVDGNDVLFTRYLSVQHRTRNVLQQSRNGGYDGGFGESAPVDADYAETLANGGKALSISEGRNFLEIQTCEHPLEECSECTNWLTGQEEACTLSEWSDWGPCSNECTPTEFSYDGPPTKPVTVRTRRVLTSAKKAGRCPPTGDTWQISSMIPFFSDNLRLQDEVAHAFVIEARYCNQFDCVYPVDCDAMNDYFPGHFVGEYQYPDESNDVLASDLENLVVCTSDQDAPPGYGVCDFSCDVFNGYIDLDGDLRDGCETYVYNDQCGGLKDDGDDSFESSFVDCTKLSGVEFPFSAPCVPTVGIFISENTTDSNNFLRYVEARTNAEDLGSPEFDSSMFHLLRRFEYNPATVGDIFFHECDLRWACDTDRCMDRDFDSANGCETAMNYVWPFANDHRFFVGSRRTNWYASFEILQAPRFEYCLVTGYFANVDLCDEDTVGDEIFGFNLVDDRQVDGEKSIWASFHLSLDRSSRYTPIVPSSSTTNPRFMYNCDVNFIESQCELFQGSTDACNLAASACAGSAELRLTPKTAGGSDNFVKSVLPGAPFPNMAAIYGEDPVADPADVWEGIEGEGGVCALVCDSGFADCDFDPNNGCETRINGNGIYPWQGNCQDSAAAEDLFSNCNIYSGSSCGAGDCIDCASLPGLNNNAAQNPLCVLKLVPVTYEPQEDQVIDTDNSISTEEQQEYWGDDPNRPWRGEDGAIQYVCDLPDEFCISRISEAGQLEERYYCVDFDSEDVTGCEVATRYRKRDSKDGDLLYAWKVDFLEKDNWDGDQYWTNTAAQLRSPQDRAYAVDMFVGSSPQLREIAAHSSSPGGGYLNPILNEWETVLYFSGGYARDVDCGALTCLEQEVKLREQSSAAYYDSDFDNTPVGDDDFLPICKALDLQDQFVDVSCFTPLLCVEGYQYQVAGVGDEYVDCRKEQAFDSPRSCFLAKPNMSLNSFLAKRSTGFLDDELEQVKCPDPEQNTHVFKVIQYPTVPELDGPVEDIPVEDIYWAPSPGYVELPLLLAGQANCFADFTNVDVYKFDFCDPTTSYEGDCTFYNYAEVDDVTIPNEDATRITLSAAKEFLWPTTDFIVSSGLDQNTPGYDSESVLPKPAYLKTVNVADPKIFDMLTDDFNQWRHQYGCEPVPAYDCSFMFDLRKKFVELDDGSYAILGNPDEWIEPYQSNDEGLKAFHEINHILVDEKVENESKWACALDVESETPSSTSGLCVYECAAGWDDCDLDPSNGCETNIMTGPCADYYHSCNPHVEIVPDAPSVCGNVDSSVWLDCKADWETEKDTLLTENGQIDVALNGVGRDRVLRGCEGLGRSDESCGEKCINCKSLPGSFTFPENDEIESYCRRGRCAVTPKYTVTGNTAAPSCNPYLCYDSNNNDEDGCETALNYPVEWFGLDRLSALNAKGYEISKLEHKLLDIYFAGITCWANYDDVLEQVSCIDVLHNTKSTKPDDFGDIVTYECYARPVDPANIEDFRGMSVSCGTDDIVLANTNGGQLDFYMAVENANDLDDLDSIPNSCTKDSSAEYLCGESAVKGQGFGQSLRLGRSPSTTPNFNGFAFNPSTNQGRATESIFSGNYLELVGGRGGTLKFPGRYVTAVDADTGVPTACEGIRLEHNYGPNPSHPGNGNSVSCYAPVQCAWTEDESHLAPNILLPSCSPIDDSYYTRSTGYWSNDPNVEQSPAALLATGGWEDSNTNIFTPLIDITAINYCYIPPADNTFDWISPNPEFNADSETVQDLTQINSQRPPSEFGIIQVPGVDADLEYNTGDFITFSSLRTRCPVWGRDTGLEPTKYVNKFSDGRYRLYSAGSATSDYNQLNEQHLNLELVKDDDGLLTRFGLPPTDLGEKCLALEVDEVPEIRKAYNNGIALSLQEVDCEAPLKCFRVQDAQGNVNDPVYKPDAPATAPYRTDFLDLVDTNLVEVPFCNGPSEYCYLPGVGGLVRTRCPETTPDARDLFTFYNNANRMFSVRFDCNLMKAPEGVDSTLIRGPWYQVKQNKPIQCDGGHNPYAGTAASSDTNTYSCFFGAASTNPAYMPETDPYIPNENGKPTPTDVFDRYLTCSEFSNNQPTSCFAPLPSAFQVPLDWSRNFDGIDGWSPLVGTVNVYDQPTNPNTAFYELEGIDNFEVLPAGTCAFECEAGWIDCDGDPTNGCEASIERGAPFRDSQCVQNGNCKSITASSSCGAGICLDCSRLSGVDSSTQEILSFVKDIGDQVKLTTVSSCKNQDLFSYKAYLSNDSDEWYSRQVNYGGSLIGRDQSPPLPAEWPGFYQCSLVDAQGASACLREVLRYNTDPSKINYPWPTEQATVTFACPNCIGFSGTDAGIPGAIPGTAPFNPTRDDAIALAWPGWVNVMETTESGLIAQASCYAYDDQEDLVYDPACAIIDELFPLDGPSTGFFTKYFIGTTDPIENWDSRLDEDAASRNGVSQKLQVCEDFDGEWTNGCERALGYNLGATCYNILQDENKEAPLNEFNLCAFEERIGVAPAYDSHFRRTLFPGFDCEILNYLPSEYTHIREDVNIGCTSYGTCGVGAYVTFSDDSGAPGPATNCMSGWVDCDRNPWNGCETSTVLCECSPEQYYNDPLQAVGEVSKTFTSDITFGDAVCSNNKQSFDKGIGAFCDGGSLPPSAWLTWNRPEEQGGNPDDALNPDINLWVDLWFEDFKITSNVVLPLSNSNLDKWADPASHSTYVGQLPVQSGEPDSGEEANRYYYGLYQQIYAVGGLLNGPPCSLNSEECNKFSAYTIPGYWLEDVDRSCYVYRYTNDNEEVIVPKYPGELEDGEDRPVALSDNLATGFCKYKCDRRNSYARSIPECANGDDYTFKGYVQKCTRINLNDKCGYNLCLDCRKLPGLDTIDRQTTAECLIRSPFSAFEPGCNIAGNANCADTDGDWTNGNEDPLGYDSAEYPDKTTWEWEAFNCAWVADTQPNAGANDFGGLPWYEAYNVWPAGSNLTPEQIEDLDLSLEGTFETSKIYNNGECIGDDTTYPTRPAGTCDFRCAQGWADVDLDPSNGCEVNTNLCEIRGTDIYAMGYEDYPAGVLCAELNNAALGFVDIDAENIYCDGLKGGDGKCHGYACDASQGYCDSGSGAMLGDLVNGGCKSLEEQSADVCGIDWAWRDAKEIRTLFGTDGTAVRNVPQLFWNSEDILDTTNSEDLYHVDSAGESSGVLPDYSFASLSNRCGSCSLLSGFNATALNGQCEKDNRYADNKWNFANPQTAPRNFRKPWFKAIKGSVDAPVIQINAAGNTLSPYFCQLHATLPPQNGDVPFADDGVCDTSKCVDEDYFWHNGCETAVGYTAEQLEGGEFLYHMSHRAQRQSVGESGIDRRDTDEKLWSNGMSKRGVWCPFLQFWSLATDSHDAPTSNDCTYFPCPHLDASIIEDWVTCVDGKCNVDCNTQTGHIDCDGKPMNGCEVDTWNDNTCSCEQVACNSLPGIDTCQWVSCRPGTADGGDVKEGFCDLMDGAKCATQWTETAGVWTESPLCQDSNGLWQDGCEVAANYPEGQTYNCNEENSAANRALKHFKTVFACNGDSGSEWAGKCEFICENGWFDCNGDFSDGCEHDGTLCQVRQYFDEQNSFITECNIALGYDVGYVVGETGYAEGFNPAVESTARVSLSPARSTSRQRKSRDIYSWWGNDAYAYGFKAAIDCGSLETLFPGHFDVEDPEKGITCDPNLHSTTAGLCVGFQCAGSNGYFDCDGDPRNGCEHASNQENCGSFGQCRNCFRISGIDYNAPNPLYILPERLMMGGVWHLSTNDGPITGVGDEWQTTVSSDPVTYENNIVEEFGKHRFYPTPSYQVQGESSDSVYFNELPVDNRITALPYTPSSFLTYSELEIKFGDVQDAYDRFNDAYSDYSVDFGVYDWVIADSTPGPDDRTLNVAPLGPAQNGKTPRGWYYTVCIQNYDFVVNNLFDEEGSIDVVPQSFQLENQPQGCRVDSRINDVYFNEAFKSGAISAYRGLDHYRMTWKYSEGSLTSSNPYRKHFVDERWEDTVPIGTALNIFPRPTDARYEGYVLNPLAVEWAVESAHFTPEMGRGDPASLLITGYTDTLYDYVPKNNEDVRQTLPNDPSKTPYYLYVGCRSVLRSGVASNYECETLTAVNSDVPANNNRQCEVEAGRNPNLNGNFWELGANVATGYWFSLGQSDGKFNCAVAGPYPEYVDEGGVQVWQSDKPNTVTDECVRCDSSPVCAEADYATLCPQFRVVQDPQVVGCDNVGDGGPLSALPGFYSTTAQGVQAGYPYEFEADEEGEPIANSRADVPRAYTWVETQDSSVGSRIDHYIPASWNPKVGTNSEDQAILDEVTAHVQTSAVYNRPGPLQYPLDQHNSVGRCYYQCEEGWADYDEDPRNGCETGLEYCVDNDNLTGHVYVKSGFLLPTNYGETALKYNGILDSNQQDIGDVVCDALCPEFAVADQSYPASEIVCDSERAPLPYCISGIESRPDNGKCFFQCEAGYQDCNADPRDGCETRVTVADSVDFCNCVQCETLPGTVFAATGSGDAPVCSCLDGSDNIVGNGSCDDPTTHFCDLTGKCGEFCEDRDGDSTNGCEVALNSVDAQGNLLPDGFDCTLFLDQAYAFPRHVIPGINNQCQADPSSIIAGQCKLQCEPGYTDCDGDPRNGCEQSDAYCVLSTIVNPPVVDELARPAGEQADTTYLNACNAAQRYSCSEINGVLTHVSGVPCRVLFPFTSQEDYDDMNSRRSGALNCFDLMEAAIGERDAPNPVLDTFHIDISTVYPYCVQDPSDPNFEDFQGDCYIECLPGFENCNDLAYDGCEAVINDVTGLSDQTCTNDCINCLTLQGITVSALSSIGCVEDLTGPAEDSNVKCNLDGLCEENCEDRDGDWKNGCEFATDDKDDDRVFVTTDSAGVDCSVVQAEVYKNPNLFLRHLHVDLFSPLVATINNADFELPPGTVYCNGGNADTAADGKRGICVVRCQPGWINQDEKIFNGCETPVDATVLNQAPDWIRIPNGNLVSLVTDSPDDCPVTV